MSAAVFEIAGHAIPPGERGIVDIPVSVLSDHTPMALSAQVVHGRREGPCAFVSGAIHGDEIIGVEIIRRLLRTPQLKSLRGTLICVPIVNTFGFINHSRYLPDRRDLNRSFPGASTGSLAARLVIVQSKLRDGSLRMAAREMGKDVLVYEAGEALRFDEQAIRIGVKGILRVLHELGMVTSEKGLTSKIRPVVSKRSAWERAPMGGVLRAYKAAGEQVEKGEIIAVIADPLGEREEAVQAAHAGLIIGRTMLPIVNEGDALFHIAEISRSLKVDPLVRMGEETEGDPLFDEDEIL